jgi:hypothetical protein
MKETEHPEAQLGKWKEEKGHWIQGFNILGRKEGVIVDIEPKNGVQIKYFKNDLPDGPSFVIDKEGTQHIGKFNKGRKSGKWKDTTLEGIEGENNMPTPSCM